MNPNNVSKVLVMDRPVRSGVGRDGSNLMADGQNLRSVDARLARIEGQIRGIRNMSTERRECVDVVTQIAAVRAALKKVADLMVAEHVKQWLQDASGNDPVAGRDVDQLLKVFKQYYR